MDFQFLEHIATLRAVVGYLGEHGQAAWWPSSFFAPSSKAFLAPVFARSVILAQCQGVRQAAAKVHDERIGIGHVYHLFRLPEDLEQAIHRALHDLEAVQRISGPVTNKLTAMEFIRDNGDAGDVAGVGPTRIAETAAIRQSAVWRTAAGHYARAFEGDSQVYPYFADRT